MNPVITLIHSVAKDRVKSDPVFAVSLSWASDTLGKDESPEADFLRDLVKKNPRAISASRNRKDKQLISDLHRVLKPRNEGFGLMERLRYLAGVTHKLVTVQAPHALGQATGEVFDFVRSLKRSADEMRRDETPTPILRMFQKSNGGYQDTYSLGGKRMVRTILDSVIYFNNGNPAEKSWWISTRGTPHVAFISNGENAVVGDREKLSRVNLERREYIWTTALGRYSDSHAFRVSPDEDVIWRNGVEGPIIALDAKTGKQIWKTYPEDFNWYHPPSPQLSCDGKRLVTYNVYPTKFLLREAKSGEIVQRIPISHVNHFSFSPNSRFLGVTAAGSTIDMNKFHILLSETGQEIWSTSVDWAFNPLFSRDGTNVLLKITKGTAEQKYAVLSTQDGKRLSEFAAQKDDKLLFVPGGTTLILVGKSRVACLDFMSGAKAWEVPIEGGSVSLSPFGQVAIYNGEALFPVDIKTGGKKWGERILNFAPWSTSGKLCLSSGKFGVSLADYSLDGKLLVAKSASAFFILDGESGAKLWEIPTKGIHSHSLYPDGKVQVRGNFETFLLGLE